MNDVPMTPHGYDKLKEKLLHLKNVERPKVIAEIEFARSLGDLSENFEYHAAKNTQGLLEEEINTIESKLSRADIIDPAKMKNDGVVRFGATVTYTDCNTDESITYSIVGEDEADIKKHLISYAAPIARGLLGHEVGDFVEIQTPGGVKEAEITDVVYKALN